MIRKILVVAAALMTAQASAASTLSFDFGGASGEAPSFDYLATGVQGPLTLTVSSRKFFLAPDSLANLSDTTAVGAVRRRSGGLGVVGGGDGFQIDTNLPGTVADPLREGLLLTGSKRFSLNSFKLSFVDANDTFQVYGVRLDGTLANLGYGTTFSQVVSNPGTIRGGLDGEALGLVLTPATGANVAATFAVGNTPLFKSYLLTTRVGGDVVFGGDRGNGFRLDGITAALPEPGTWAMLIGGFGLAGASMRRQRKAANA